MGFKVVRLCTYTKGVPCTLRAFAEHYIPIVNNVSEENITTIFHSIARFPNVVQAIDGTLMSIKGMSGNGEPIYISRKNFHALNIREVVDDMISEFVQCSPFTNTIYLKNNAFLFFIRSNHAIPLF